MFKSIATSALLALALGLAPAVAQTPPAVTQTPPTVTTAPSPVPSDAPGASPVAPVGKTTAHDIIDGCRTSADAKGLKREARRSAIIDCVSAQRPHLAARMVCRQQGKAQGLKDDELKGFIKDCVAKAKT